MCRLVYLCAQEGHNELTNLTTIRNVVEVSFGSSRGDRNPLFFIKRKMLVSSPMPLTNIFEQIFGASHYVTTNDQHGTFLLTPHVIVRPEVQCGKDEQHRRCWGLLDR